MDKSKSDIEYFPDRSSASTTSRGIAIPSLVLGTPTAPATGVEEPDLPTFIERFSDFSESLSSTDLPRADSGYDEGIETPLVSPMSTTAKGFQASAIPPRTRPPRRWLCEYCEKAYTNLGWLRRHERDKHSIFTKASGRFRKRTRCSSADNPPSTKDPVKPASPDSQAAAKHAEPLSSTLRDTKAALSSLAWSNLEDSNIDKAAVSEIPGMRISGDELMTTDLSETLKICLSVMPEWSTPGFRIPVDLHFRGITTKVNIDVYKPVSQTLHNSNTLQSLQDEVTVPIDIQSDAHSMENSNDKACLVGPLEHQNHSADTPSPVQNLARLSNNDRLKKMNSVEGVSQSKSDERDRTKYGEKRKHSDAGVRLHFEGSSDASDEEEGSSDYECENITTCDSCHDDLPLSFLPYLRGHETDTSSLCSDTPGSGSSTSGTASQHTPASSTSFPSGGNGLNRNAWSPPGTGSGSLKNSNNPILGVASNRAKKPDPQLRPLICWYAAAGSDCTAKHIKRDPHTRRLWRDHAWGSARGLNHRLPNNCQLCSRLFPTQDLLQKHIDDIRLQGPCPQLSATELEERNREPNRCGISKERYEAIEEIRKKVDNDEMLSVYDEAITELLKQRVESNIKLYINESNISEKTAESELWKWYLIFKQLRPDDEVPLNPFTSKQQSVGPEDESRASALCLFDSIINQLCIAGRLPKLNDNQRNALNREAFLVTLEMLGADEAQKKKRPAQSRDSNARKKQKLSPPERQTPNPIAFDPALVLPTPNLPRTYTAVQNQGQVPDIVPGPGTTPVLQINPTFRTAGAQQQYHNFQQPQQHQQQGQDLEQEQEQTRDAGSPLFTDFDFDPDSWTNICNYKLGDLANQ